MNYMSRFSQVPSDGNYKFNKSVTINVRARYKPTAADYITKFYANLSKWKSETYFVSSPRKLVEHDFFKKIVRMGDSAVPLILDEIKRRPSMIILALEKITGETVVSQADKGNVKAMTDAWLLWGKRVGHQ